MTEPFDPDATLIRVLTDPACIPDPYPLYNQLRDHAPIFQTSVTGTWVVNRYEDAKAMLRDPRCGSGAALEDNDRTAIDGSSRRARHKSIHAG